MSGATSLQMHRCHFHCSLRTASCSELMSERTCAGPKGFYAIFVLQQLASISNNVAAQVECSLVIKVRQSASQTARVPRNRWEPCL